MNTISRLITDSIPNWLSRSVSKPQNLTKARSLSSIAHGHSSGERVLAIALGSNLGDKVQNIETALRLLESHRSTSSIGGSRIRVIDTSFMYESAPMYVHNQPRFVNAACLIQTSLEPQALLNLLKDVEEKVGRVPGGIVNGPRIVDLDIIFDDDRAYILKDIPGRELIVPHPRVKEREFVLRPLADMIPMYKHPVLGTTISTMLSSLSTSETPLRKIISFPSQPQNASEPSVQKPSNAQNPVVWHWGERTLMMGTLNTTPDSFSDGGDHYKLESAMDYVRTSTENGADILDIGGYSTRPGSKDISPEEETRRVVTAIKAVREYEAQHKKNDWLPISVDTFRGSVAEAAIQAGANCINDVYALTGPHIGVANVKDIDMVPYEHDENIQVSDQGAMLGTASELGVPVILMHSRGPADKNKDYSQYSSVLEGVKVELERRIMRALRGGIRRWNIILDPGIGFSKTVEGNIALMVHHKSLTDNPTPERSESTLENLPHDPQSGLSGYPTLIGTSRKTYLGKLTGKDRPKDREWATATAVAAAVQQHADLIRVHDVVAHKDVITVADALWRKRI